MLIFTSNTYSITGLKNKSTKILQYEKILCYSMNERMFLDQILDTYVGLKTDVGIYFFYVGMICSIVHLSAIIVCGLKYCALALACPAVTWSSKHKIRSVPLSPNRARAAA